MVDFEDFITGIRQRLNEELPGVEAQTRMAPAGREPLTPSKLKGDLKEGAVLVLLFPQDGKPSTLFTVRRPELRHHGGQISFPGGRRENGESLDQTALRETKEEVGIETRSVRVLGRLTPLFIPPSGFVVQPFVAAMESLPQLKIDETEVERTFVSSISELADSRNQKVEKQIVRSVELQIPCFQLGQDRIWGATAMITSELLALAHPS
jgi:8-oxo-dGTP pyrophosphatase MutT (NUDIX family)